MATVRDVLASLEAIAPSAYALPGDRIGLQVGDISAPVTRAVVSLDHSAGAVQACLASKAELLLCHHPLTMTPLSNVNYGEPTQDRVVELVKARVAYIAAHTNWDCAPGGVNDALAEKLGLLGLTSFGTASAFESYNLVVFCPSESLEAVVDAATGAGAGSIGDYCRCAFYGAGEGTFDASAGGTPAVGSAGARNKVPEIRVEMEVPMRCRSAVETAVRAAHPYEESAIDFLVASKQGHPISRKGRLPKALDSSSFCDYVDKKLGFRSTLWAGGTDLIEWVGVCGGAASDEWSFALAAGCHALVTGEVKQHHALDASEKGIALCAAGHYATEQPGVQALAAALRERLQEIEWTVFDPAPGSNGRPL